MTSKMLIRSLAVLCLLPPLLQVFFWPGSTSAHNIATFLTGQNDWRLNPITSIAVMMVLACILLTEATIKIWIRSTTTTTTNPNGAGRNKNPIKNMIVIQGFSALLFSFLHKILFNFEAAWLVFPRLLLGIPSSLMFVLFFLWSDEARSYAWRRLSCWRLHWQEVREGLAWPRWWRGRVHPQE